MSDWKGNYPYAYGRMRGLVQMAIYDLQYERPRDLLEHELERVMREIEDELKGEQQAA